jgi:hypothetical protein
LLLDLPRITADKKKSCIIPKMYAPYKLSLYGNQDETNGLRTLKDVAEEIKDLLSRYVVIFPDVIEYLEKGNWIGFRCMVNDEASGISRGILERIGYQLEESDFSPYRLYWITLKTKIEK